MLNNTFAIPGSVEQPNPEAFLNNATNSQEVMAYVDQIYSAQESQVNTTPQIQSIESQPYLDTEMYHEAAVAEALTSDQMRHLSMPEYLVAAPPEYQKERAINVTRLIKAYRDDTLARIEGDQNVAA